MPKYNTYGHADVEGVFGAPLGDLQRQIGGIDHILADAFDFVTEDNGIVLTRFGTERFQRYRMDSLFHSDERVSFRAEGFYGVGGSVKMLPGDAVFRSKGRFVNFR